MVRIGSPISLLRKAYATRMTVYADIAVLNTPMRSLRNSTRLDKSLRGLGNLHTAENISSE